jgi:hypothetical protein
MPLIESLPAAIDRADAGLIDRRSAVAALLDGDLSETFRPPPIPPDSSAAWTTLPLYPTSRVSGAQLRLVREHLGRIELIPPVPPSGLPMFANYDKRIVPGSRRTDPLLVSIDDRQR